VAVSFDAQAFRDWTGTGGTFTLTPVGVPRGIAVLIAQAPLATDQITSVSYGGSTLTRVPTNGFATVGDAEPGASYMYFRGTAVPTSGTVNVVSAAGTFTAWGVTVTANQANTEIAASGKTNGAAVTNPAVTLATSSADDGVAVGVLYSGQNAPSSIVADPGFTALTGSAAGGRDFGLMSAGAEQGRRSGANAVVSWTVGSDDACVCAALIREVAPAVQPPVTNFSLQVT
jgi:hypothetical protein